MISRVVLFCCEVMSRSVQPARRKCSIFVERTSFKLDSRNEISPRNRIKDVSSSSSSSTTCHARSRDFSCYSGALQKTPKSASFTSNSKAKLSYRYSRGYKVGMSPQQGTKLLAKSRPRSLTFSQLKNRKKSIPQTRSKDQTSSKTEAQRSHITEENKNSANMMGPNLHCTNPSLSEWANALRPSTEGEKDLSPENPTPPLNTSVSPEIPDDITDASISTHCFGAGHILHGIPDKRKCRPRGVLIAAVHADDSSFSSPPKASLLWWTSPTKAQRIHGESSNICDHSTTGGSAFTDIPLFCADRRQFECEWAERPTVLVSECTPPSVDEKVLEGEPFQGTISTDSVIFDCGGGTKCTLADTDSAGSIDDFGCDNETVIEIGSPQFVNLSPSCPLSSGFSELSSFVSSPHDSCCRNMQHHVASSVPIALPSKVACCDDGTDLLETASKSYIHERPLDYASVKMKPDHRCFDSSPSTTTFADNTYKTLASPPLVFENQHLCTNFHTPQRKPIPSREYLFCNEHWSGEKVISSPMSGSIFQSQINYSNGNMSNASEGWKISATSECLKNLNIST